MIKVFTDAAVNGQQGMAGIGIVILQDGKQQIVKALVQKVVDNHQAELLAIQKALQYLIDHNCQSEMIFLYSDSKFAVSALAKNYTRQTAYQSTLADVQRLKKMFPRLFVEWHSQRQNRGADQLARQVLWQALKKKRR